MVLAQFIAYNTGKMVNYWINLNKSEICEQSATSDTFFVHIEHYNKTNKTTIWNSGANFSPLHVPTSSSYGGLCPLIKTLFALWKKKFFNAFFHCIFLC